MQVIIDGVPFAPACSAVGRIGIAITTHNRADVLSRAIAQHQKYLPTSALVVVIGVALHATHLDIRVVSIMKVA